MDDKNSQVCVATVCIYNRENGKRCDHNLTHLHDGTYNKCPKFICYVADGDRSAFS